MGGEEILSAIIVRSPNPLVAGIHDRMPVMLLSDDYDRWLNPAMTIDELRAMLKPYDADRMKTYEVSRAVNSVKTTRRNALSRMRNDETRIRPEAATLCLKPY